MVRRLLAGSVQYGVPDPSHFLERKTGVLDRRNFSVGPAQRRRVGSGVTVSGQRPSAQPLQLYKRVELHVFILFLFPCFSVCVSL